MKPHGSPSILYPPGCLEVTEGVATIELLRRLKSLVHTLHSLAQDEHERVCQEYIPLALHIADDFFLSNPSRDVKLLVACCIAEFLRLYAPEAPYKDPAQVKAIFMFLINQLGGLKNPKDPAYKHFFYLLENLTCVKAFNMCFDLEDCQIIFCKLFKLIFDTVHNEHSGKVKSFMLDLLCTLISESDMVSNNLLDIILYNVVEPAKSQRRSAYQIAKALMIRCSDTLEPFLQLFFNNVLMLDHKEEKMIISRKVYSLIYELNHICPSVLLAVFPQLEYKLKSADQEERLRCVSLLAQVFSEKGSTVALNHALLWEAFLGRFSDISILIRTKCIQCSTHLLLNHPLLRKDVTETLKLRQYDAEENIRYEVIRAIVAAFRKDTSVIMDCEDLLYLVKERIMDKKFKVRKEAICGLAVIYKKYLNSLDVPLAARSAITGIKNDILYSYYTTHMEERLLVEQLLNTCLVPYQLPPKKRMEKLFCLFATMDKNATKAFIDLQKHQSVIRQRVTDFIRLHRKPQDEVRDKEVNQRVGRLTKYLPDPLKVMESLKKFSQHLSSDSQLLVLMETVVSPNTSCMNTVDAVTRILKKLGEPATTNLYYNTIKIMLERVSNIMVDQVAVETLLGLVEAVLHANPSVMATLNLDSNTAVEKGLELLLVLSHVCPAHFLHTATLQHLTSLLKDPSPTTSSPVLSALTHIGKCKPIGELFPDITTVLIPMCLKLAECGTPKEAKHAVRCLYTNCAVESVNVFKQILEKAKEQLTFNSMHFRTSLVSLGHIAFLMPQKFLILIKEIVSRKVVCELLVGCQTSSLSPCLTVQEEVEGWVEEEELTEVTLVKMEGIKVMARWLVGLKSDVVSAKKTFRLLNTFIYNKGDLISNNKTLKSERAYLRLSAGVAMLKICKQKGVGDQVTSQQIYNLSILMNDECPMVRQRFAIKLHNGLARGIPNRCLPLDFMGFYALAGKERNRTLRAAVRQCMVADITKRREYVQGLTMAIGREKASSWIPHIMPDYMLAFAVPILAHQPDFKDPSNTNELIRIRNCLWFILEPLMAKNDSCLTFYTALIQQMKNHKDAIKPEDKLSNQKLWAVCDLAMGLVLSKTKIIDMKESPAEPWIPLRYFKKHDDPNFVNAKSYLPLELQVTSPKGSTKAMAASKRTPTTTTAMVTRKHHLEDQPEDNSVVSARKRKRSWSCFSSGKEQAEEQEGSTGSSDVLLISPTLTPTSPPTSKKGCYEGDINIATIGTSRLSPGERRAAAQRRLPSESRWFWKWRPSPPDSVLEDEEDLSAIIEYK